ncbi:MAG: family 2 glycosyl transferase [Gammaproteobacteria bacterium]|nr:MAG: family 2 glycosyl transferase [Gammaproteobacteria bacterium]TND04519.1 MAG: family 2 glycosyl transferase [Gammaproteobacteria bacterium]
MSSSPLVSIITPVYNGESYLSECIESILTQTYQHWEYIIVNNRSTDRTREIIAQYVKQDARIRVHDNEQFVGVIENHNIAFQQISPTGKYCKLVQADDWLDPECIERMVNAAEATPSAGVIGSYCLAGNRIRCDGLPNTTSLINGKDLAKLTLLGKIYLFWSPSCLMIRSDLVRNRNPFYRAPNLHADVDALYELLHDCDFTFVHQVLSFIRTHQMSMTAQDAKRANTQRLSHLHLLLKFGPAYLDTTEFQTRLSKLWKDYYQSLAITVFDLRTADFWKHQKAELQKLGYPLNHLRLLYEILITMIVSPREVARHLKSRLLSNT